MDSNQLVTEATLALETYRRLLSPGLYFFAPEVVDGKPTGRIVEEREDYASKADEEKSGVTFGFYPLGFVPDHLKNRPILEWLYRYPFIAGVSQLSQAPESFLEAITQHVNQKFYSQAAGEEKNRSGQSACRPFKLEHQFIEPFSVRLFTRDPVKTEKHEARILRCECRFPLRKLAVTQSPLPPPPPQTIHGHRSFLLTVE